ncbi:FxsA family protein [Actinocorallia sp. B10E7]|uniref:FxsA family protein n=1 Tax=Actinocorallia sp. B10E7 TaxID=3153558 RepID=UPI00325EE5B8
MRPLVPLVLLALPVLEIMVMIQVGRMIGGWGVALLLLAQALLGSWIVKHEGRRAWRRLNEALASGRTPERGSADAALILLGGVLLALPGFLTDLPALALLLPFTRPLVRGRVLAWAERRASGAGLSPTGFPGGSFGPFAEHPQRPGAARREDASGPGVIRGEVIKDGGEDGGNTGGHAEGDGREGRRLEP